MEITYDRIDLEECRRQKHDPAAIITRQGSDVWMVPTGPVIFDRRLDWAIYRQEEFVYIPLIPYLVSQEPDLAMAFALSQGLRCACDLANDIKRLHIATGVPVEQLADQPPAAGLRYYIGFAALIGK